MKNIVPMCLLILLFVPLLNVTAQEPSSPPPITDSLEAQNVPQWVRAAPPTTDGHFNPIGAANFMAIGPHAMQTISRQGTAAFYADETAVQDAMRDINRLVAFQFSLYRDGGMTVLRDVQTMPWGMIEPVAGAYDFRLIDTLVFAAQEYGLDYVATVMPFAAWDLAPNGEPSTDEMCVRLMTEDYYYLQSAGVMGRYHDIDAYLAWLAVMVERYDGDGVDDMPDLTQPVRYWQIHNEPENDRCGLFRGDEAAFVELMQRSYDVVHGACADCLVINGGAGFPLYIERDVAGADFWQLTADMGIADYIDIIAIHYNNGKTDGGDEDDFATQIRVMRDLMGADKPVWVTEFGTMVDVGQPTRFTLLSETEAAAWYMRFYTVGLAHGVDRFFSDTVSFFDHQRRRLLPYYTNIVLEQLIANYSEAEMLAAGQYRFVVDGQTRYVLWSGVPSAVQGHLLVTDMYGNQTYPLAADLAPTPENPLIVEILE